MAAAMIGAGTRIAAAEAVWVLDDPQSADAVQAIGVAERLGVPFRRIPLGWNWLGRMAALSPRGSLLGLAASGRGADGHQAVGQPAPGPAAGLPWQADGASAGLPDADPVPTLVLSAGSRAAAVALWLKQRYGVRIVQCGAARPWSVAQIDMLVLPMRPDRAAGPPVFPVLGALGRVSPLLLRQTAALWRERLDHLPRPRVLLQVGGPARGSDLRPALAHELGRRVAGLAGARGGSVLAMTSARTGYEATEALAAGLAPTIALLHRWGEPGEDPALGLLALADAVVATADLAPTLADACAGAAGVYVAAPELAGPRAWRLLGGLLAADQVRWLDQRIAPWPREPLDEAGRVAAEIRRRFPLD